MKLSELYSDYIANWISDGLLINRDKISLIGIKPLFDRIMTNGWITKVWMITAFPVNYDVHITHKIRKEMFLQYPEVDTVIHTYSSPVSVNVNSEVYKRHLKHAASRYHAYQDVFEKLSEEDQLTGVIERDGTGRHLSIDRDTLMSLKNDYDSYSYVYDQTNSGKYFSNTYYFIQASAKTRKELKKYKKSLTSLLNSEHVRFREIRGGVDQYLDNFCPASYYQATDGKYMSMLFSQENVASLVPNKTRGLVSSQGLLIGLDWESKLPFFLDLFSSGAAQVVLMLGKSGCGKTYLAFLIAIELIGFSVHCSVTDIKGNEWAALLHYVKGALRISMSGNSACFVNTLRLDDVECNASNCVEFYEDAVRGTADILEIATNLQASEGNAVDLRAILTTAIDKLFVTNGVVRDNPKTFVNTKNLKYADVIDMISTLENTKSYTDQQRYICKLVRVRCSVFFSAEGSMHAAFQKEVSIADVLQSPFVIYEFNKNSGEVLDTLDSLKVYMCQFLDGKKHNVRKQHGLHTAAFYEELQRCLYLDKLMTGISAKVTGSRSNNLSVFLLLNAVSVFQEDALKQIKSNITTKIIGKCDTDDSDTLVKHFDCGKIADYMERVRHDPIKYAHCFSTLYDTGNDTNSLILKSVVPKDMCEHFNTRDRLTYAG